MKVKLLIFLAMLWSVETAAKLPPPTPEEAAKKQVAAEKKAKEEDAAKEALAKAQDRVAQRYRATRKDAPPPVPVAAPANK